jgi:hypothetical protein
LVLWPVIGVDADKFTPRQVERLHKRASDTAQILDRIAVIGGFASNDFDRLVRLGNSDNIEGPAAITVMHGFSD